MTTHYQTLGLDEGASAEEIRRAYRRLVLLTHPDRTPDPAAHARYLLVNEAYEVLSDARRRAGYDALLWVRRNPPAPSSVATSTTTPTMPRPVPVRRRPLSVQERYAAQYARMLRVLRPVMLLGVLLSASLLADWLLARVHTEHVRVLTADVYYTAGRYPQPHVYFIHHTERGSFDSDTAVGVGETVLVRRTPLWRKALQAQRPSARHAIKTDTIYADLAWLVPLGLGVLATLTLWPRLNPDYRLGFGLCSVLLLGITLYEMWHH
ncbi:DnaJ domain-containing protein [Hymenobacter daecheongensis DSM 21074]|uniref:DnaJ domain-containing protein n=1 Tax=Hymenobacter daecheongensis DSM 21074 TaxID=1121955 RepID=A0A1M6LCA4_9BACT|nr:J domain-containing protein [Hymenobacter daecheongensis]SHJ68794.1 DnaJ domain-containing protein [Hymenobacter daecheongensis DSM 21074]